MRKTKGFHRDNAFIYEELFFKKFFILSTLRILQ